MKVSEMASFCPLFGCYDSPAALLEIRARLFASFNALVKSFAQAPVILVILGRVIEKAVFTVLRDFDFLFQPISDADRNDNNERNGQSHTERKP